MSILFIVIAVLAIIVLMAVLSCFYIVKQQEVYIIETLGKFSGLKQPGFHVKLPAPIQRVAAKVSMRTMQVEQQIDAKTKDNVTATLSVVVQYHVDYTQGQTPQENGAYRYFYRLAQPIEQMNAYVADAIRSSVPQYTLDELFEKKEEIANDTATRVGELMLENGIYLVSTLIVSIQLPPSVEKSMNDINAAQRQRQAAQDLAEAEKIKRVTEATAEAEAMEKTGQGIAAQRIAIAQGIKQSIDTIQESGVSEAEANELFLFTQWTEMMDSFAKSGVASTIVLPSDFNESKSMFSQLLAAKKGSEQDGYTYMDGAQFPPRN